MTSYLPDVNVWVALAYRGHQHCAVAAAWFARAQSKSVYFCRITQLAFLRLLTHPAVMREEVKTPLEAWTAYDVLMSDPRVVFHEEIGTGDIEVELRALTATSLFSAPQWLDAYLVAFASAAGLTLVTFDRGLSKLTEDAVLLT